jgi:hypothetical protein
MEQPMSAAEVPGYIASVQAVMPEIHLEAARWAAAGDDVLIEWTITGTVAGQAVSWSGADRFTLRGEHAVEGVAYFDTLPLWARLDPSSRGVQSREMPAWRRVAPMQTSSR